MPRQKLPEKFKYTVRKNETLYVVLPLPGLKYPVWRICRDETQAGVNAVISRIRAQHEEVIRDFEAPETAGELFDFWLTLIEQRVSERTLENYRSNVERYLRPVLGDLPLLEVTGAQLKKIYTTMSRRGLKPLTIKRCHAIASMIFKEAVNLAILKRSPAARIKLPIAAVDAESPETNAVKVLSPEEVKRFRQLCQTAKHGIIFEFALETGMRPGEYLALTWNDIDLEKRAATVSRALVYEKKGGGYYFIAPKTKRSHRTIPLKKRLCDKLAAHRAEQNELLKEIRQRTRGHFKPSREHRREINKQRLINHRALNLVFPSEDFTPIKDKNLANRYFKPLAEQAGLDSSFSPYSLRHTCAVMLLLLENVSPKTVSERLGHSSVEFTEETYQQILEPMSASAAKA